MALVSSIGACSWFYYNPTDFAGSGGIQDQVIWKKPAGPFTHARIVLIGGGGGGGGGRAATTGNVGGGGGGGGGAYVELWVPFSALGNYEQLWIGRGGDGGAARSPTGNGNLGRGGTASQMTIGGIEKGDYLSPRAYFGAGGLGGTTAGGTKGNGAALSNCHTEGLGYAWSAKDGGAGGASATLTPGTNTTSDDRGGNGGGGGGGNATSQGLGGYWNTNAFPVQHWLDGDPKYPVRPFCGRGGDGGDGVAPYVAAEDGGFFGAGGGGGYGALNADSGAGGNGGPGCIWIVCF